MEVVVSRVVVLLTSVTVITHSARRVVQQERDGLKLQDECENSASHTHTQSCIPIFYNYITAMEIIYIMRTDI